MRVRISYAINVDDDYRRALRIYRGETGLATRAEIQDHYRRVGGVEDDDIMDAYGQVARRARRARPR